MPLDTFVVSLAPGEPAALLACGEPGEAERWDLSALAVPEGYAGALVVAGKGYELVYVEPCRDNRHPMPEGKDDPKRRTSTS